MNLLQVPHLLTVRQEDGREALFDLQGSRLGAKDEVFSSQQDQGGLHKCGSDPLLVVGDRY